MAFQHSIVSSVSCKGIGLHSGQTITLTLHPAMADTGILFRRSDVEGGRSSAALIPASYIQVCDTTLCSVIENAHGTRVGTVEHLMAALWGMGVDNAVVELDGPEVPIMDGSAEPFVFLIECAGVAEQAAPRRSIVVDKEIRVQEGNAYASIHPYGGFALDISIDFDHSAIGKQRAVYDFSTMTFKQFLSRARTFGFERDVEKLRATGLARGGSLANAVVLGEQGVLNEEGLRYTDEFVRHKALDCVGDYFLAGYRLQGMVTTSRPGHAINNKLLKALLSHKDAWHLATDSVVLVSTPKVLEIPAPHTRAAGGISAVAGAVMFPPRS